MTKSCGLWGFLRHIQHNALRLRHKRESNFVYFVIFLAFSYCNNIEICTKEETITETVEVEEYETTIENVIESENTENSTTYELEDGKKAIEYFAQDQVRKPCVHVIRMISQTMFLLC